ncbi:MAG: GNAT family N-acetyltransferase, partial [Acidobacteriota bacterium]
MHKVDRIELLPANAFSIRALTAIYNQSRADYLVAMPMSEAQLQDYLDLYDIDLACSVVVRRGERFLGLGMLGVRDEHSWITRLGVLAQGRRTGVAKKIVSYLLAQAIELGHRQVLLEVIHGNAPARRLFEG